MSTVSSTDVKLFVALANPENTHTDVKIEEILSKANSVPKLPVSSAPGLISELPHPPGMKTSLPSGG